MTTIKTLAFMSIAMLAAVGLRADTLLWQVNTQGADGYTGTDASYAALYKVATADYNSAYSGGMSKPAASDLSTASGVDAISVAEGVGAPTLADIGTDNTGYSFLVELYNSSGDAVYTSYATPYDSLVSSGYVSTGGMGVPEAMAAAGGGGFNGASVPEPTSGLLILVGAGLLGLRRRKQA